MDTDDPMKGGHTEGDVTMSGGAEGIRTPGLLTASQARSQLRHSPRNAEEPKA